MHAYKGTDEFVRKKEWQVIWVHIGLSLKLISHLDVEDCGHWQGVGFYSTWKLRPPDQENHRLLKGGASSLIDFTGNLMLPLVLVSSVPKATFCLELCISLLYIFPF